MPSKIPVIDAPSVGVENPRAAQIPLMHTGEGLVAEAAGGAIRQEVVPVLAHIQDAADVERVNVEMESLAQWKRSYLDDPQNGVLARRGTAAIGSFKEVNDEYEARVQEIKGKLQNGNQQRIFSERSNADRKSVLGAVHAHENEQAFQAGKAGFDARMSDLINNGSRDAAYGESTAPTVGQIVQEHAERAPLEGWDPETTKALVRKRVDELHENALRTMIYGRRTYGAAKSYLTEHEQEMDPKTWATWTKHLEDAAKPADDMAVERRIWAAVEDGVGAGRPGYRFNEGLAQAIVDEFPSEEVGRVRAALKDRIAEARREQDRADVETIGKIDTDQILKAGRVDRSSEEFQGLDHQGQSIVLRREEAHQRASAAERSQARVIQNEIDRAFVMEYRAGVTEDDDALRGSWMAKDAAQLAQEYPDVSPKAISNAVYIRNLAIKADKQANPGFFKDARANLIKSLKDKGTDAQRKASDEFTTWWEEQSSPPSKQELVRKAAEIGGVYVKKGWLYNTHVRGTSLTPEEREQLKLAPPEDQKFGAARSIAGADQIKAKAKAPKLTPQQQQMYEIASKKGQKLVIRKGQYVGTTTIQPGDVEIKP